MVRPILAQKVLLQLGQGRLSPGSTVLALSFLVSLLSSATRVRFSSQFTAPLCVRERQPGLSVAASSQVSGFMLKALREAFKVSLNRVCVGLPECVCLAVVLRRGGVWVAYDQACVQHDQPSVSGISSGWCGC